MKLLKLYTTHILVKAGSLDHLVFIHKPGEMWGWYVKTIDMSYCSVRRLSGE